MSAPVPEDAPDTTLDPDCDPELTDALDHDTDLGRDDDGEGA